jgi:putative transposase
VRRGRYAEEQIISVLKEAEAHRTVEEIGRERGIADQTHYRWKAKYGKAGSLITSAFAGCTGAKD